MTERGDCKSLSEICVVLDQIDHPKKVGQSLCVHGGDSEK